jgi:hypothetical protein
MRGHEEATIDLMREEARLRVALMAIRDMPMSEQDDMLSANMRKIAADALAAD